MSLKTEQPDFRITYIINLGLKSTIVTAYIKMQGTDLHCL